MSIRKIALCIYFMLYMAESYFILLLRTMLNWESLLQTVSRSRLFNMGSARGLSTHGYHQFITSPLPCLIVARAPIWTTQYCLPDFRRLNFPFVPTKSFSCYKFFESRNFARCSIWIEFCTMRVSYSKLPIFYFSQEVKGSKLFGCKCVISFHANFGACCVITLWRVVLFACILRSKVFFTQES